MVTTAAPAVDVLSGFGMGISLIAAIGAQNVFVLRQGIRRQRVALVVLVCALSDAVLIVAGVAGVGAVIESFPTAVVVARFAGAIFLAVYGALAARRAIRPSATAMVVGDAGAGEAAADRMRAGVVPVLLTCLAFTWLNPHVYLDTVLLLGSVAASHGDGRWLFAGGAVAASVVWFSALGWGSRALAGAFSRPGAWRILDGFVAVVMLLLAANLVLGA